MKIAIVHDWLIVNAGAEKVLEQMLKVFPEADLYATIDFLPESERGILLHKNVRTTYIQRLPFAKTSYRHYLPLMPLAVEQFDLTSYDLVISSSHAVAKGVITGPDQKHLCMCYSPMRYAWDMQHCYLQESSFSNGFKSWLARYLLHGIRQWDYRTAQNVDHFIAISKFVQRRIWKFYRRKSTVVYPPVDVDRFKIHREKEDFYLTASRLVPYKRIDLIVEAFAQMPDKKLLVIGSGPEMPRIKRNARKNVQILGQQPEEVLINSLQRARAFIFAAEEDFGIAPLEAQACGTPVIAYGKGGVCETIQGLGDEQPSGIFFEKQCVQDIVAAVSLFEQQQSTFHPEQCRQNALRFSQDQFRIRFREQVSRFQ